MSNKIIHFLAVSILALAGCGREKVDLLVVNANVYMVDSAFGKAEAFAVKDGRFVAVGSDEELRSKYRAAETLDAEGKTVYPGFMDGHSHFVGLAEMRYRYADLTGCESFEEVIERLKAHAESHPSEWLLGRGWDQNLWEGKKFPDNERLNELFGDKKVALTRIDGHAGLVNDNVLKMMGYDEKTVMDGGKVLLDASGRPTGVLLDAAYDRVKERIAPLSGEERTASLIEAQKYCFSMGLSAVTDAGLDKDVILLIDSLQERGEVRMKLNAMINPEEETMEYFLAKGPIHKERLAVCSLKLYADGALGSRGAHMLKPYADDPKNLGIKMYGDEYYDSLCGRAYDAGYQVCTHAIGDAAVRDMLRYYSTCLRGRNDRRWRIEHSQVVDSADFDLYGRYSIVPSIQSTHATSDMSWAHERLGDRVRYAYAYQRLLKQNGWVVNGTDFPIEGVSPIGTFYAAVARKDAAGNPVAGWQMENALTREQALRSITIWVARGYFEEQTKGSIEVGKEADFVLVDRDIMTCAESEILGAKVLRLYVSGRREV